MIIFVYQENETHAKIIKRYNRIARTLLEFEDVHVDGYYQIYDVIMTCMLDILQCLYDICTGVL